MTGLLEACGYATLVFMIERTGKADLYGAYVTFQVGDSGALRAERARRRSRGGEQSSSAHLIVLCSVQVLTILPPNLLQAVDYITVRTVGRAVPSKWACSTSQASLSNRRPAPPQLGKVLLNSPDIVAGRRWLSSTFISVLFTSSDVLALM